MAVIWEEFERPSAPRLEKASRLMRHSTPAIRNGVTEVDPAAMPVSYHRRIFGMPLREAVAVLIGSLRRRFSCSLDQMVMVTTLLKWRAPGRFRTLVSNCE